MKKYAYILIILFLYSCINNEMVHYQTFQLSAENSMSIYPDSTFFSDIRCMKYHNNKLYLLDAQRADVVVLDSCFKNMQTLNIKGRAKNELLMPFRFNIHNDTIFVVDFGSMSLKYLNDNGVIGHSDLPKTKIRDSHFAVTDSSIIFPASSNNGTFVEVSKANSDDYNHYGDLEQIGTDLRNRIWSNANILSSDEYLILAYLALPHIDIYDIKTKKIIQRKDLSSIPFMAKNLDAIESEKFTENQSPTIIVDACVYEDDLFALYSNYSGGKYASNIVVRFSLSGKLVIKAIYTLPGVLYESICVSPTHLFAFNSSANEVQTFCLPKLAYTH